MYIVVLNIFTDDQIRHWKVVQSYYREVGDYLPALLMSIVVFAILMGMYLLHINSVTDIA